MLLGLMGAMPEEMNKIIAAISNKEIIERGGRLYYKGKLYGQEVVAVFSRWGKVAAATTATNLIVEFGVEKIVFTGIAGAISPDLSIGDIVIAQHLFQHDMDARPLMRRFEIPLTGKTSFEVPSVHVETMQKAVHNFLKNNEKFRTKLAEHNIAHIQMHIGDAASGDQFVSDKKTRNALLRDLPSVLCVEMEGAAVAQVCDDYSVPVIIVRVISDSADESASVSAMNFVTQHAGDYSLAILKEYFELITKSKSL
ncbi:MAG: 5'-methylthioadenosine/adenosylhomocysteine nucleosidase [Paludibacter sp.]|jgi:adenosylhomocysteine nucleosidase|nr:5'-methylthioadenosine/adenosylhomocysteine nucleosidase [Paludibacter sp.]